VSEEKIDGWRMLGYKDGPCGCRNNAEAAQAGREPAAFYDALSPSSS
jgi:hypothetical protein